MPEMLNIDEVRPEVLNLIENVLQVKLKEPSVNLVEKGMIDSLNLVTIIVALEKKFGIEISFQDLDMKYFKDIDSITNTVISSKRKETKKRS